MVLEIDLSVATGAIFSEDRKYRYALWRVWNPKLDLLLQIGLNPSKAAELRNDPTITRGIVRANRNRFGGFLMGNIYAYVSTDPNALLQKGDFIGELNDYYLRKMLELSNGKALCGWGSFKPVSLRAPQVLKMIREPYCLGINADGQPKHPLYVGYDVPMTKYTVN